MKRISGYIGLVLTIVLVSCSKEQLPTDQNLSTVPVFEVSGTIDGNPVLLQAGENNVFMDTYQEEVNGVNVFSGSLSNGAEYIKIGIHDGQLGLNTITSIPQQGQSISFAHDLPTLMSISHQQFSNADLIQTVSFKLDGVAVGNQLEITEPGVYNVCATVTYTQGGTYQICNDYVVGYKDLADVEVQHIMGVDGNLRSWLVTNDPVESVDWYLNNSLVTQGDVLYAEVTQNVYYLKAVIHFANGITRERNMLVDGTGNGKFVEDLIAYRTDLNEEQFQDFKLGVEASFNGVNYSLVNGQNGQITIQSFDYYGLNANNKKVYLITGTMQATLQDGNANNVDAALNIKVGVEIEP